MARAHYKRYSVYNRKTDMPVIIHGTTPECMAATGLTKSSFYIYVTRTRKNAKLGKYDIYEDDPEEGEGDE
jgi:hypothetical protein